MKKKIDYNPQFDVDVDEKPVKKKKSKSKGKPNPVIYILSALIMIGVIYHSYSVYALLSSYTFLPEKYIKYAMYGLLAINIFFAIYAFLPVNNLNKILQSILCFALAFGLAFAGNKIPEYKGKMERLFTEIPTEGEMNINVYVLNDSGISDVKELNEKVIAIQSGLDADYQEYALKIIKHELDGVNPQTREYEDIYETIEALYNKEVDAIILNESYMDILRENEDFKTLDEKVTAVYTCTKKIQLEYNTAAVGDITKEPFVMMVGGNDNWTYGSVLNNDGRTDVNLLTIVNPKTKQILLISIPRDAYLGLWGNSNRPDKLTHSTWYGMDCWMETIDAAFDVKTNYFIRVGFSSIVNVVDALGGIDLVNEYEFSTHVIATYDPKTGRVTERTESFPAGPLHLDGTHALAFCRERKNLRNGDFGRNAHQAQVLKALIDRVTTVEGITHIGDLMDAVKGTFSTNITMDQIYALAQMQLDDMANWRLVQYSVTGSTAARPSYIMGLNSGTLLSVVLLDQKSVNTAKGYIEQIMNNEIVVIEN